MMIKFPSFTKYAVGDLGIKVPRGKARKDFLTQFDCIDDTFAPYRPNKSEKVISSLKKGWHESNESSWRKLMVKTVHAKSIQWFNPYRNCVVIADEENNCLSVHSHHGVVVYIEFCSEDSWLNHYALVKGMEYTLNARGLNLDSLVKFCSDYPNKLIDWRQL